MIPHQLRSVPFEAASQLLGHATFPPVYIAFEIAKKMGAFVLLVARAASVRIVRDSLDFAISQMAARFS